MTSSIGWPVMVRSKDYSRPTRPCLHQSKDSYFQTHQTLSPADWLQFLPVPVQAHCKANPLEWCGRSLTLQEVKTPLRLVAPVRPSPQLGRFGHRKRVELAMFNNLGKCKLDMKPFFRHHGGGVCPRFLPVLGRRRSGRGGLGHGEHGHWCPHP